MIEDPADVVIHVQKEVQDLQLNAAKAFNEADRAKQALGYAAISTIESRIATA